MSLKVKQIDYHTKPRILLITFLVLMIFYILYLTSLEFLLVDSSRKLEIFVLSWIGLISFIYMTYSAYLLTDTVFSPYSIFLFFFYLFNLGQTLMWAIGMHSNDEIGRGPIYPGYHTPSGSTLVRTLMYVIVCMWMFHLGSLFATQKVNYRYNDLQTQTSFKIKKTNILKIIFIISCLFGFFSIPITIWRTYSDFTIARTFGYRALYHSEYARGGASLVGFFSNWFYPSLIGLLIGSQFKKTVRRFVYIIIAIYVLLNFSYGDRGSSIYLLTSLLWLRHTAHRSFKIKQIIKYGFITIVLIYILDAIVALRNTGINIEGLITAFSMQESPITKVFFEMGTSMTPTTYLHQYGLNFWEHGNTYLLAFGGLITNRILDFLNLEYGVLSRHFGAYLGLSWGPGFSIVAEPLINFGYVFAPLFMILKGFSISKLLSINKFDIEFNPLKLLFVTSSLEALINLNRNGIHVILKNWFYGTVFFCMTIYIINKILTKPRINL